MGNRGFLVTFHRVDPLFTLDLSDPTQPTVAGRLTVPGYSDFILPMDNTHLLTIGKDAQNAGSFSWLQGIKLAIFDVTDAANPALLHTETIGGRMFVDPYRWLEGDEQGKITPEVAAAQLRAVPAC